MVQLPASRSHLDEHPSRGSHRDIKILAGRKPVRGRETRTSMSQSRPCGVYTGTLAGLVAGDNITATYDSPIGDPASATVAGGPYAITAALGDPGGRLANYSVTVNSGQLSITPATLTVTTIDSGKIYGQVLTSADYTGSIS